MVDFRVEIFQFLISKGYFISKRTELDKIQQLLKMLYPIKTNKELIRIGDEEDGGYLIPDDLKGVRALFSPGVGTKFSFEKSLSKKGIKKIFLADYSVNDPNLKDLNFVKKFVGLYNSEKYIKFDEWIKRSSSEGDIILQMDIEGSEYEIFLGTSEELLERFRIMIVEFHNLHLMFLREFFSIIHSVFRKLLQSHWIVHIHPNNASFVVKYKGIKIPSTMEFTFYRKDRAKKIGYVTNFPHYLDKDNIKNKRSIVLPECFYKG